ncbi:heavy-metal-associated domain-containing protein [Promicromonospora thailandica]|uniref:Copper chaperone CopZ n=1 Tax=Promicromonospora thailandica TaxID=765201 RepID=A0A9X2FXW2_9MICO|nr:heavy metal-associated domain-containing protein [Promicromonospora thailandica]MCP2263350.1 Copper chaperone CopZ [Promicromonospora thailandica]
MTTVTTLAVTGMTCGHCVSAVTGELRNVPDVQDVTVELHAGETSQVRVISDAPLAEQPLRDAVDEAGYAVSGVDVLENAVAAESAAQAPGKQAKRTLPIIPS